MEQSKPELKKIFYQLDPRFFKDSTDDGVGDLKGLISKIDYFGYLGIDYLVIRNVLRQDIDGAVISYFDIEPQLGTLTDLQKLIKLAGLRSIKIILDLPIGRVKETHQWFQEARHHRFNEESFIEFVESKKSQDETQTYKYEPANDSYYPIDERTQEVPLNWKGEKVIKGFSEAISFWHKKGIAGFTFTDFEYIMDVRRKEIMSAETISELKKLYQALKSVDPELLLIGRSHEVPLGDCLNYAIGDFKIFDYILPEQISLLGTDPKFGVDKIGRFKPHQLRDILSEIIISPKLILSFGSSLTGRINSRWGDEGQYSRASAKALAMLLILNKTCSSIYYGDEIGSLNIGLTHLDDFQDLTLKDRKRFTLKQGVTEKEFMAAQILQNPINSKSLMSWNEELNGGFSNAHRTIVPISKTYKEFNVLNQYGEETSPLVFYKKLIKIAKYSIHGEVIALGDCKVSKLIPGVIKMRYKWNDQKLIIYVNLTNKNKPIKFPKQGKIILTTNSWKNYSKNPTSLEPYEGVVVVRYISPATQTLDFSDRPIPIKK